MPGIYADYGGCGYDVHLPAVTEPVHPRWRDVVIMYAEGRKYGGFHPTMYPRGNERRYMSYQEDVNMSISCVKGLGLVRHKLILWLHSALWPFARVEQRRQSRAWWKRTGNSPSKGTSTASCMRTRPVQFWIAGYEDV